MAVAAFLFSEQEESMFINIKQVRGMEKTGFAALYRDGTGAYVVQVGRNCFDRSNRIATEIVAERWFPTIRLAKAWRENAINLSHLIG
jgi:hypothetical protein